MITNFGVKIGDRQVSISMDLDPNNRNECLYGYHAMDLQKVWGSELVCIMFKALRDGDFVIDVGANCGLYSIIMAQLVGPKGKLMAFEPVPEIADKWRNNIQLSKVTNASLVSVPLSDRVETVRYYVDSDGGGSGSGLWDPGLWYENVKSKETPISFEVNTLMLDGVVASSVRFIKIDTEGADEKILRGASTLLERHHPPYILVELNPFGMQQMGCSTESFRSYMRGFGYEAFLIDENGRIPALVPKNTEISFFDGVAVLDVLFSTVDDVGQLWPKAPWE